MKTLILSSVLILSGCASGCREACMFGIGPGNSFFDSYADMADKQDPCQMKGKPENYEYPKFCGSSTGKIVRITKLTNNSYLVNKQ